MSRSAVSHHPSAFICRRRATMACSRTRVVLLREVHAAQAPAGADPAQRHALRAQVVLEQPVVAAGLREEHRPHRPEVRRRGSAARRRPVRGSSRAPTRRSAGSSRRRARRRRGSVTQRRNSFIAPITDRDAPRTCRPRRRGASGARGRTAASDRVVPQTTPIGRPPATVLPYTTMSAWTPKYSCAPPGASRKPV